MSHAKPTEKLDTQVESVKTLNSAELFAGQKKIIIEHNDFSYTLRITRENKLILTK